MKQKPSLSPKLSLTEKAELKENKDTISRGIKTTESVLTSVSNIVNKKLWREEATCAAEFFDKNWGLSKSWLNKVCQAVSYIDAQKFIRETTGEETPDVTSVKGALRARKEERSQSNNTKLNNKMQEPELDSDSTPPSFKINSSSTPLLDVEQLTDTNGTPIPILVQAFWERRVEIEELLVKISEVRCTVEKAETEGDRMYAETSTGRVRALLDQAYTALKTALPYAVCTQCGGHPEIQPKGSCPLCYGRGLISKFRWDGVAEEIRNMVAK